MQAVLADVALQVGVHGCVEVDEDRALAGRDRAAPPILLGSHLDSQPTGGKFDGNYGVLAGIEDDVSAEKSTYTKPEEVEDFVEKTGVDSLAISIGTSHGAMKFKPEQCTRDERGVRIAKESATEED